MRRASSPTSFTSNRLLPANWDPFQISPATSPRHHAADATLKEQKRKREAVAGQHKDIDKCIFDSMLLEKEQKRKKQHGIKRNGC